MFGISFPLYNSYWHCYQKIAYKLVESEPVIDGKMQVKTKISLLYKIITDKFF